MNSLSEFQLYSFLVKPMCILSLDIVLIWQLPGLLSLSTKFLPTVMNILKKLAEEGQRAAAPQAQRKLEDDQSKAYRNGVHNNATSDSSSSVTSSSDLGLEYTSQLTQ